MENKNRIENFEEEIPLKIRNQTFTNEIDLDQYLEWNALAGIIFVNCRFEELDLLEKVFGSCDFKDCKFNNLSFRKCQFSNCKFENCQIVNSDLTRAEFDDSSFRNSQFLKSDLAASDFRRCELVETTFKNSNLDRIVDRDIKCWKLNQLTKIKKSSSFANILKDINLASSDEG
jgi:uncharacterized protein YjbI with pentapeptide repeats